MIRDWLDAHVNRELGVGHPRDAMGELSLRGIEELLTQLGSPQLEFSAIHIGGTNGKTTTTRIVAALLQSAGLSVGAYTSPHLAALNERIVLNGEKISDRELDSELELIRAAENQVGSQLSYFEILTAAACSWFCDNAVQVGAVEVGLGGQFDATNVVGSVVTVITNIALDHTEYFGNTRAEVAQAEAGIVNPGTTLVLGENDDALASAFLSQDAKQVRQLGVDFGLKSNVVAQGGRLIDLFTPRANYEAVLLSLHGAHQGNNAALAVMAAEAFLQEPLPDDVVREALGAIRSPGRLEVVAHEPLVLLDGAHNPAGMRALRIALDEEFVPASRVLVVGMLKDKDPLEMLSAIGLQNFSEVIVTAPNTPRALRLEKIAEAIDQTRFTGTVTTMDSVEQAIAHALATTNSADQIIVAGSLYVVGAARKLFV